MEFFEGEAILVEIGLSNVGIVVDCGSSIKLKEETTCNMQTLDPEPYFLKNPGGLDATAAKYTSNTLSKLFLLSWCQPKIYHRPRSYRDVCRP